jgi:hypothetical protein
MNVLLDYHYPKAYVGSNGGDRGVRDGHRTCRFTTLFGLAARICTTSLFETTPWMNWRLLR